MKNICKTLLYLVFILYYVDVLYNKCSYKIQVILYFIYFIDIFLHNYIKIYFGNEI